MGLSTKPYLIRAIHEWCTDSGYRPYIAVSVDEHTIVPHEFVRGGEIVLNVSPAATNRLRIGNDLIEFEARFGGVARAVSIPIDNVSAIYAQETGQGMAFEVPKPLALAPESEGAPEPQAPASGPVLVEAPAPQADASQEGSTTAPAPARKRPRLAAVPTPDAASPGEPAAPRGEPQDAEAPKPSKRRRKAPAGKAEAAATAAGTEAPAEPASGRAGKGGLGAKAGKEETASTQQGGPDDESPTPPPKGPPRLTRVK